MPDSQPGGEEVSVSTAASSGNLGPGFDYIGLALDLRTTARVSLSDAWHVSSPDPSGIILKAAQAVSDQPVSIHLTSEIPMGKGLGSSAACITATLGAVLLATSQPLDLDRIVHEGFELEDHYDNVAAAVYGGLVVCSPQGYVKCFDVHERIRILIALPDETLPTDLARLALPGDVPLGAAARTASRTVFLIEGLRTGNLDLLKEVGQDELHEPHRIRMRPVIGKVITAARSAGAAAAVMSGAGPAVLAFTTGDLEEAIGAAMLEALDGAGEVRRIETGSGIEQLV
ncbi:MAG: homoserine kinase [Acidimicrobiia bacterium]|nr:homoserine kinase [Acidimicrobiia bacterium]